MNTLTQRQHCHVARTFIIVLYYSHCFTVCSSSLMMYIWITLQIYTSLGIMNHIRLQVMKQIQNRFCHKIENIRYARIVNFVDKLFL